MRAQEFIVEVESSSSILNLISTLEALRSTTDQIRVDSLVNLVRKKPGSEMFNVDILVDSYKNNDTVKNMVDDIKSDDNGVRYVYLKSLTNDEEVIDDLNKGSDSSGNTAVNTVSSMAKRAAKKRI